MSFMVDVTSTPDIYTVTTTMALFEVVLYAVVPFSLPLWMAYKAVQKKLAKRKLKFIENGY